MKAKWILKLEKGKCLKRKNKKKVTEEMAEMTLGIWGCAEKRSDKGVQDGPIWGSRKKIHWGGIG